MQLHKMDERGSVMVEVLAVLALLGVMAPMLVRQIALRSEEMDNVNMASEIRTIAEGVDAYLQADRSVLEASCPATSGVSDCTPSFDRETLCMFLPNGFCGETADDEGVLGYYDIGLSTYLVDENIAPRPVFQALIVPTAEVLPSDFTLKRASRVASMIGVNGGIVQRVDQATAHGTAGAWQLNLGAAGYASAYGNVQTAFTDAGGINATYVALVTLSSFTPEVYVNDGDANSVSAPVNMGFQDLHAWNYFSVGQAGPNADKSCIEQRSNEVNPDTGAVQSDVISGPNGNCDPLFWVGVKKGDGDNSEAGHVYAKNNLYVGRDNVNDRSAIALETGTDRDERRIVVFDEAGQNRVTIDARGQVVLKKMVDGGGNLLTNEEEAGLVLQHVYKDGTNEVTKKEMVIKAGEIRNTTDEFGSMDGSDDIAFDYGENNIEEAAHRQYRVDLNKDGESLLHEIRLGSRGGARLSELLPNYIAKQVYSLTSSGNDKTYTATIQKPDCPFGYAPALIVTPTRWDSSRVVRINAGHSHLLDEGDIANIAKRLEVDLDPTTNSGTISAQDGKYNVNVANNNTLSHVIGSQNDSIANTTGNMVNQVSVKTQDDIITRRARFAVEINNEYNDFSDLSGGDVPRSGANATGDWTVKMGYKNDDQGKGEWSGSDPVGDSISALAQTYCVYIDGAKTPNEAPLD